MSKNYSKKLNKLPIGTIVVIKNSSLVKINKPSSKKECVKIAGKVGYILEYEGPSTLHKGRFFYHIIFPDVSENKKHWYSICTEEFDFDEMELVNIPSIKKNYAQCASLISI